MSQRITPYRGAAAGVADGDGLGTAEAAAVSVVAGDVTADDDGLEGAAEEAEAETAAEADGAADAARAGTIRTGSRQRSRRLVISVFFIGVCLSFYRESNLYQRSSAGSQSHRPRLTGS
jgi:hypothetical protein